ncbi:hypothetical protein C8Q73DRAFT_785289 [Cubamyces lactineus]|nr:hypothetical protein C8Q73DRAFT_785289 [Cubamyces lactineus]
MQRPHLQRNPQNGGALRDSVSAPSLGSDSVSDPETLAGNEVVVYYDSARPTDGVRLPPVRMRSGTTGANQPAREPGQMQMRARAHSVGSQPTSTAPLRRRPLVRAVGRATGKIVRLVIRSPLRKRHARTHGGTEPSQPSQALSTAIAGDWRERARASGISIVIESDSDTVNEPNNDSNHIVLQSIQPCDSTVTVETPDGTCLYVSPPNPNNSEISILEPYVSPYLDEETAYELITSLYYGHMQPNEPEGTTNAQAATNSDESDETATTTTTTTSTPTRGSRHRPHHHHRARGRKMHAPPPTPPAPMLTNVVHIVLFFPWCVAVGGLILVWPSALERITFRSGFLGGPPPQGLRRFAYWVANAYEHAFIFLACAVTFAYYRPFVGLTLLWLVILRFSSFWLRYLPETGLWERIGESDVESLWLIGRGKSVIDAAFAKQCNCVSLCECHGLCPLRCPEYQDEEM